MTNDVKMPDEIWAWENYRRSWRPIYMAHTDRMTKYIRADLSKPPCFSDQVKLLDAGCKKVIEIMNTRTPLAQDPAFLVEALEEVKGCLGRDYWPDKKATYNRLVDALQRWREMKGEG